MTSFDKVLAENKILKEKLISLSVFAKNIELHKKSYLEIARELQTLKGIEIPKDPIETIPFEQIQEAKDWSI